jgi:YihY family inner membrane protein
LKKTTEIQRREWAGWSLLEIATDTFRGFRADRGFDLAGSLAFTTLLTAIPLCAAFSTFLVTFFRENDDQILSIVNVLLPYQSAHLTQSLRDFIAESTAISGVGLALVIVASVRLIFVVEGVFNAVWGAPRRRMSLRRVALYTFALLSLALVLGGIGWGMRAVRHSAGEDSAFHSLFVATAPFLQKAGLLTLLVRVLPNARVRIVGAAVGGAAVALALELLRLAFGIYVETVLRMNLITGTIGFVFLAILSLYLAWALILLGVELTHVLQTHVARAAGGLAGQGRAERAVRMLLRMSSAEATPVAAIQPDPETPPAETLAILEDLKRAGLVSGDEGGGFRLAVSSRKITVGSVVEALTPDLFRVSPHRDDRVSLVLEPLFLRLDSERRALLGATLYELKRR